MCFYLGLAIGFGVALYFLTREDFEDMPLHEIVTNGYREGA